MFLVQVSKCQNRNHTNVPAVMVVTVKVYGRTRLSADAQASLKACTVKTSLLAGVYLPCLVQVVSCHKPLVFEQNLFLLFPLHLVVGVAAVLVPIIVVLIIMILATTLFVCVRRRHFKQSGLGGSTQSVSFRSGTNVEFSPNFMRNRQPETNGEPLDAEFGLNDANKPTDFSNPMYDAIGNADTTTVADDTGKGGLYEVPGDVFDKKYDKNCYEGSNKPASVGSAVLHPSMVLHRSSPHVPLRQTALDPTTVDTDKDTQNLVEEDKSEC